MKKLLMSVLAVGALSALAETSPMENPAWGYQITGLPDAPKDVVCVFTNAATDAGMTWSVPNGVETFQFLVVGGGGSGSGAYSYAGGGGGGGGGFVSGVVESAVAKDVYDIKVGAGGAGVAEKKAGNNGGASSLKLNGSDVAVAGGGMGAPAAASNTAAGGGASGTSNGEDGNAGGARTNLGGGGGGGAGHSGSNGSGAASNSIGGAGGAGLSSEITGILTGYAGGGAGGTRKKSTSGTAASDGGAQGGDGESGSHVNGRDAKPNLGGGGGGGGKGGKGGAGGSGVVIIRYSTPDNRAQCPSVDDKTYSGSEQCSGLPALGDGWELVEDGIGTEVGEYSATVRLLSGYLWSDDEPSAEREVLFSITPAANAWTEDPFVSPASWFSGDTDVTLLNGETTWGPATATYTLNGEERGVFSFDVIPTEAGDYVVTCTVPQSKNWTDPEPLTKTVSFTVVDKSGTPPFDVAVSAITPKVADDKLTADITYALSSEIASDNKVTLKALYSCDPSVTNEAVLATDVALDAAGTVTLVAELAAGTNYDFLVYGESEDGVFSPMDASHLRVVRTPGPATDLAATAVYSAEQGGFVISGAVVPGLGTTTVTVRWALNSKELDQQKAFDFAFGADGAFTVTVPSGVTDGLNWTVVSSNEFGGVSWNQDLGEQPVVYPPARDCAWAGADGAWSVAANWTDAGVPGPNDHALFTNGTSTVTVDENTDANSPAARTLSVRDGATATFVADGEARTFATYDPEKSSPTLVGADSMLAFSGTNLTAALGVGSTQLRLGDKAKLIADDGANVTVNKLSYGGSSVTLMATNQATLTCATTATAEPDGWTFIATDGGTLDLSKVTLKTKKFTLKAIDGAIKIYSMPTHSDGTAFYLDNGVINVTRDTNKDTEAFCLGSYTSMKTITLDFRGNRSSILSPNCKVVLSNGYAKKQICTINLHPDATWVDSAVKIDSGNSTFVVNKEVVVNVDVNGLRNWHGRGSRKMVIKLFKGGLAADFTAPTINVVGDEKVKELCTVTPRKVGNASYNIDIEKKSGLGFAVIIK